MGKLASDGRTVTLPEVGQFIGFSPCLGIEVLSVGVKPNKHGGVAANWRCIYWSPPCFSPWRRLTSIGNQWPPSLRFPTVPSLQLSCICGAITVRGRQPTHSLKPRWLVQALYLLWDRLWTCQTDSNFCLFSEHSAPLGCLPCEFTLWPVRCYSTGCYACLKSWSFYISPLIHVYCIITYLIITCTKHFPDICSSQRFSVLSKRDSTSLICNHFLEPP